jgi:tetratricopeptide (TPR) repeat protein
MNAAVTAQINISQLRQKLKDNPKDSRVLFELAKWFLSEGYYKDAKDQYYLAIYYNPHLLPKVLLDYESAIAEDKNNLNIHLSLVDLYLSMGEIDNAIIELEEVLLINGTHTEIYNLLGSIYIKRGRFDDAINLLEQALKAETKDTALSEMLAGAYLEKERYEDATRLYEEVLKTDSTNKKVLRTLSELYKRTHNYEKAAESLQAMITDDPELSREVILKLEELAHLAPKVIFVKETLAEVYARAMRPDEATLCYMDALSLDAGKIDHIVVKLKKILKNYPQNPRTQAALAEALVEKGQFSEAVWEYRRLIEREGAQKTLAIAGLEQIVRKCPEQVMAREALGDAYLKDGKYQEAVNEYSAAVKTDKTLADTMQKKSRDILKAHPNFLAAYLLSGEAHIAKGEAKLALARADEMIALDKKYIPGYLLLSDANLELRISRRAEEALVKALELDPFNITIHEKLKAIRDKAVEQEIESIRKKLKEDEWRISFHLDIGKLLLKLGRVKEATKELQIALKDRPRISFAYNLLGSCFKEEGRFDLASAQYQKASENLPPELSEFGKNVRYNLGLAYEAQGLIVKAISAYESVMQEDVEFGHLREKTYFLKSSKLSSVRFKKIICFRSLTDTNSLIGVWGRDKTDSEKLSKQAETLMSFGQTHNHTGFDFFMRGMVEAAKEEFNLSINMDSSFASALSNLAVTQMISGSLEEAELNLIRALDLEPQSAVYYNNLAMVYYQKGNLEKARRNLEKASNFDEEQSAVWLNLGDVYYAMGLAEMALNCWQKIRNFDVLSEFSQQRLRNKIANEK